MRAQVSAIAAIGKNRELGKDNKLIWKIPDDLKRLRALTVGHPVIMGRKTFESIVEYIGKPLPERPNIVVTHNNDFVNRYKDIEVVNSVEGAIEKAEQLHTGEIFIIGGTQIFEAALPLIDKLYLTIIDAEDSSADAFFSPYEKEFTKKVFEEAREWNGLKYRWVDLERE
jgi:dihydrofolate reductase